MARVLVIVNPMAARTGSGKLRAIEAAFRAEGWGVDVVETAGPGGATVVAKEQGAGGDYDVVAPYGGDGTMIEAVTGLRGTEIPVGLLPGGTGNVLSGNLRLPRNPVQAAHGITQGVVRQLDLGRYRDGASERFFAIACGAGFEARLMETTSAAKRRWGLAAYFSRAFGLLSDISSIPYTITVDGVTVESRAATVTVANCEEIIPPFLSLKDGIELDDGLLDVIAVDARHAGHAFQAMWQLLTGRTEGRGLVSHLRGREISVTAESPQPTGLDGEVVGMTPFTADLLPGELRVVTPRAQS